MIINIIYTKTDIGILNKENIIFLSIIVFYILIQYLKDRIILYKN